MAHCAEINTTGTVLRVIVVSNDVQDPEAWCAQFLGGTWKQTSYSGSMRGKFAGIGDRYDEKADMFVSVPKP